MTEINNEANVLAEVGQGPSKSRYLAAFAGALLGALVGAIPWAAAAYFGWFVGWLGFLIGFLSIKGYELLGGKSCKVNIVVIIITTLIGVLVGNIAGDVLSISKEFALDIKDSITLYFLVWSEPDIIGSLLFNFILGIGFAALGVWTLFKGIISKAKGNSDAAPIEAGETQGESNPEPALPEKTEDTPSV